MHITVSSWISYSPSWQPLDPHVITEPFYLLVTLSPAPYAEEGLTTWVLHLHVGHDVHVVAHEHQVVDTRRTSCTGSMCGWG